jgi:hypothetical protein
MLIYNYVISLTINNIIQFLLITGKNIRKKAVKELYITYTKNKKKKNLYITTTSTRGI